MKKIILRKISHIILGSRRFHNQKIKKFAKHIHNKKILEIGSGDKNQTVSKFFSKDNEFIKSDIDRSHGHLYFDVTNTHFKEEFDVILCLNVLEHVFNFQKAADNIHKALVKNGVAFIAVPVMYPLHMIPNDYFRFTEYSLRKIFSKFNSIKISHKGLKRFPISYVAIVRK